jgi:hypothetical protein
MRFITEFSLYNEGPIADHTRVAAQRLLGAKISGAFGWEERGETTLAPNSPVVYKYQLEIEAFPMDKWVEFKEKMFVTLNITEYDRFTLSEMIKELESFGKSATKAEV